jgi:serine/threonine-protein phosphatase 6 regulatory ankyrin repeat subunit B
LLENNADIGTKDKNGQTVTHYAVTKGRTECLKLLLENHADIKAKDQNGFIALQLSLMHDKLSCEIVLKEHLQIINNGEPL